MVALIIEQRISYSFLSVITTYWISNSSIKFMNKNYYVISKLTHYCFSSKKNSVDICFCRISVIFIPLNCLFTQRKVLLYVCVFITSKHLLCVQHYHPFKTFHNLFFVLVGKEVMYYSPYCKIKAID